MASVLELWHLPSKNMIGSWETVHDAVREIRAGVGDQYGDVLLGHVLVSVDDDDTTQVVAEGAMVLGLTDNLQTVAEW